MSTAEIIAGNLLSPVVLAFLLGAAAVWVRSDLKFPDPLYSALTIYLLFAIGLKGGMALRATPPSQLWLPALGTVAIGAAIPLWCFPLLRRWGKFSVADAASIAIHYGSVSAVTFLAVRAYLESRGVSFEGFLPALVALLEVPAIVVGLLLARRSAAAGGGDGLGAALKEVLAGKSIVLLLGGTAIGALASPTAVAEVSPFFVAPFKGVLVLFLLEMGMVAARRARDLPRAGAFLVGFAIVMPLLHGAVGALLGRAVGLSQGGSAVLATLAASASYIAAPAACRVALPEANPAYSLAGALAITFPFNLTVGIPAYHWMTTVVFGGAAS